MPNNIQNIITLEGNEQKIREMLKAIQNDELGLGTVDFNKIIPMPESIKVGEWELGKTAWDNLQNYGFPAWYEWRISNWGTKWNAYGYDEDTDYSESSTLDFQTAWSAPHPVIQKLAQMYPEISFEHRWVDKDNGCNCGRKCYSGGECTEEYYPENEIEAIEFACDFWDCEPSFFDLMLNKAESGYINIYDESFDLIKLCGKLALFTKKILTDEDIPEGLFCYHLRNDVNYEGSVITYEPICFGEKGCISLTKDAEPKFTGEKMTFGEYMQDESQQSEGDSYEY